MYNNETDLQELALQIETNKPKLPLDMTARTLKHLLQKERVNIQRVKNRMKGAKIKDGDGLSEIDGTSHYGEINTFANSSFMPTTNRTGQFYDGLDPSPQNRALFNAAYGAKSGNSFSQQAEDGHINKESINEPTSAEPKESSVGVEKADGPSAPTEHELNSSQRRDTQVESNEESQPMQNSAVRQETIKYQQEK